MPNLKKYLFSALPIFLIFVLIATAMNIGVYHIFSANGIDETFNMFFISPYFECMFPVLDLIQLYTPFPVFLISYILLLCAFSYAIIALEAAIVKKKENQAKHLEQLQ